MKTVSARQLVNVGVYPNTKKARMRLYKMALRGQVRDTKVSHTLPSRSGHPEKIYTIGVLKNPVHAFEVAELVIAFKPDEVKVGDQDVNPHYLADADVTFDGEAYLLELDRDTENDKGVIAHMKRVAPFPGIVLWVAHTKTRLDHLKEVSKSTGGKFVFALFNDVVNNTWEEIWSDAKGEISALPHGDED